jgi:predicted nuclease of predicted toxin-antitoxin system
MKLLFDQNLSFKLCGRLTDVFPGSNQVRLAGLDTADDRAIWEFAKANGLTIVSQDSDFADMAALFGPPPKVIWLRCGNQTNDVIEKIFRDHAASLIAFEQHAGAACWELY